MSQKTTAFCVLMEEVLKHLRPEKGFEGRFEELNEKAK